MHLHVSSHTHTHTHTLTGLYIDIIQANESKISEDGSLILKNNVTANASGSGLLTNQSLPSLPAEVDTFAISWCADTEVSSHTN